MALDISQLTAEVERSKTVDDGILAVVAAFEARKGDPVAIQALADSLKANNDSLAAAIVANTPAAP